MKKIFKKVISLILAVLIMAVQLLITVPVSTSAETIGTETQSGTLGNIEWRYGRDEFDGALKLFISGEG
ncbi:MAG: hypothetical protein IJY74_00275, partial [Oscillospiraceae bacterium]|nr:hypothetical protein [Oscillospiraceae bacterium]